MYKMKRKETLHKTEADLTNCRTIHFGQHDYELIMINNKIHKVATFVCNILPSIHS